MIIEPPSEQVLLRENVELRARLEEAERRLARLGQVKDEEEVKEELRRCDMELRTITDNAPGIIGRLDRELRHVFINRAITAATGRAVEEYLGKTNEELGYPPELCALWNRLFRKVFDTGEAGELKFVYGALTGMRWYHIRVVPEFAGDGTVESVVFVSTDISELKQMEENLRLFCEHAPVAIAMLDTELRHVVTSQRWMREFGLEGQDITGRCHYDVFPEIPERWREIHQRCLKGAVERAEEDRLVRADGSIRRSRWEIHPWYKVSGAVGGIIIFSEDITNRKRVEEALDESRERLSLALASSGAAVFEWNMVNNTRIWDANVHRLLGTDPRKFKGTTEEFLKVIHPEDREAMRAALGAVSEMGRLEVEYRAVLPDGSIRHVASRGKVQRDGEGRALRLTGVTWDITARKEAEEQIRMLNQELESRVVERTSELMTAVNSLETEIAERHRLEREILEISEREKSRVGQDLHDGLCQELAGIAFLAKALKRNLEEEKLPAGAASEKADEIANLLKETIEEARGLATGMYPVSIEESGLEAALGKLAADTAERFHVACEFKCAEPVVLADKQAATHVYRITQEAVSNAIRHGRAELVVITLAAEGDRIRLRIEDNGEGRLKEMKPTGMGLKTMNYRARSIGGELEIRQRRGTGIAMVFTFPNRKREG